MQRSSPTILMKNIDASDPTKFSRVEHPLRWKSRLALTRAVMVCADRAKDFWMTSIETAPRAPGSMRDPSSAPPRPAHKAPGKKNGQVRFANPGRGGSPPGGEQARAPTLRELASGRFQGFQARGQV